ncbi:MAG TPA: glycosyltransferase family 39 protein, partial [Anaerolineales bacterium]|nr:glycosyltransferase family 39 protein [Anaerolineales bacterium]
MNHRKLLPAIAILAWSGFVVAAYFVVQKPLFLPFAVPLMNLAWTFLVTSMLLLNALVLGLLTIRRLIPDAPQDASLLALACGVGLGELGLLGFILAAMGASEFFLLLAVQGLVLSWSIWSGRLRRVLSLVRNSITQIGSSASLLPRWMQWAVILTITLNFLMAMLPPADAFDALLYHLTVPKLWLQDGGLRAYNIPHYWFPGLVEGIYFWGLGLGSEIVSHLIHFTCALCVILLVWDWTRRLWGDLTAGWAVMLLVSMPSLLLLATWPYTDLALIFFGLAMLYTLAYGQEQNDRRWWTISAICAGMAMGVKYTSFVMPLTAVILIVIWTFQRKLELFTEILKFGLISAGTGLIWYLRNWIWMGNPVYPFLFGGRYWDEFRAIWYAGSGTGSGWDLGALVLLPLTITLGYQDVNSIDSDIGPLILLLLPAALWAMTDLKKAEEPRKIALTTIGFFTLFSAAFWTYGYITTRNLWQTRLLLPAIVPFVIPAALGVTWISRLDTKSLRLSFIISGLAAISIYANLVDTGLRVLARNPLAIATGIVTTQSYFEKYQPGYAYALQAVDQTNLNSRIYSLFEPRSYSMTRPLQPDPILDNFSHDVYLYEHPESVVAAWRSQGYTHVLL